MSRKRDTEKAAPTGRSHAPNTSFVQYRKNEDEPTGIRVRSHPDYAAELQAEKDAAGADWHCESLEFFERLRG